MFLDIDEISLEQPESLMTTIKEEPSIENADLAFEEIMVNENNDQYNYNIDESSSMDSFQRSIPQNQTMPSPPPAKRTRLSTQVPPSFQANSTKNHNSDMHELQIQLLKRQIEVQDKQIELHQLMAKELQVKIERTEQLMKLDAAESKLRCKEIAKRLESEK